MPSGKPIDWSIYDDLIIEHLPDLTIKAWRDRYVPDISTRAIGDRARKLGIKPAKYRPTKSHREAISSSLLKETPEIIEIVKSNINNLSRIELAKLVGLSPARLNDLINRHNITMSDIGYARAREATRMANIGKIPWNKSKKLSTNHIINPAIRRMRTPNAVMEKMSPNSIKMLVSFADPAFGHDGTLYKAANWEFDGETQPSYFYIDDNGHIIQKKTLYNMAKRMGIAERDYAKTYGYEMVRTPNKLRFIKRLR